MAEAMATALEAEPYNIRTSPFLPDTFSPPIALVAIKDVTYHEAFGVYPLGMYRFDVYVICARPSDRAGIQAIEAYMSSSGNASIRLALESDPTWGGVVDNAIVRTGGPMVGVSIGTSGAVYISVPFVVEAYTS
jgi:hypothetical protein